MDNFGSKASFTNPSHKMRPDVNMMERPPPLFKKSLPSEKRINKAEADRAFYIDFEGFVKEAPAMIGILVENHFEQIVLDAKFRGAAAYKDPMTVMSGESVISNLLSRSLAEDRKIVAFSTLEKEQCMRWYGVNISQSYVNAKSVAGRWARKVSPKIRCRTLKDFEVLSGYERSRDTGYRKNTSCLNAALRDLERYGELQNTAPKKHWTNLRKHNRQDVEAMKHILLVTFSSDLSHNQY
jgi:hypothetical protein